MSEQSIFPSLIKLARLKFLIYSALAYSLGTLACLKVNLSFHFNAYFFGLISIWLVHLMTHFFNEYYDLEADKANKSYTTSTGGSRVLVDGHLKPSYCLFLAYFFLSITVCLAFFMPNKVSLIIFIIGIVIGYSYTSPPFSLNYNKLGELSVATTLSFLVPLMGFSIQTGFISFEIIALLIPTFFFQFTRMLIMNLADYEGDLLVNKLTLTATLGSKKTIRLYGIGQLIGYVILIPLIFFNLIPYSTFIAIIVTLPIAIWQFLRIKNPGFSNQHIANSITFWASTQSAIIVIAVYVSVLIDLVSNYNFLNSSKIYQIQFLGILLFVVLFLISVQIIKTTFTDKIAFKNRT